MKTSKLRSKPSNKRLCNKTNKRLDLYITHDRVKGMAVDRLEILKAKCEQEIKDAEDNLRVLKAKLANLVLLAHESEKLANPESEPDKYAKTGYTEAVYDAIKSIWAVRKVGVTTGEIKNYLIAHGFKSGSNFDTSVYTILNRLVEGGKVACIETRILVRGGLPSIPGRKTYKPK